MKVSIITINFNNAAGLEKTIASVVNQTYPNIEYLVIDGGSDDGSELIAQKYIDNIAYFITEKDNGIYHAMNKGIAVATGDYVLFLNSGDCLIESEVIEKVVKESLIGDIVYGDLLLFDDVKEWVWKSPDTLTFEHFYHNTIPHPSTFINRQLFEKVGYYDEKLQVVSDWKFFLLAFARFNCSYKHVPITISTYGFDGISSKEESLPLIKEERSKVLQEEFSFFLKDYEKLVYLTDEMKKIKRYLLAKTFIKRLFKRNNLNQL